MDICDLQELPQTPDAGVQVTDPLKRPLLFGDIEQIKALKKAEEHAEFTKLKKCEHCNGSGTCCTECFSECAKCDGIGKDREGYSRFMIQYPNYYG